MKPDADGSDCCPDDLGRGTALTTTTKSRAMTDLKPWMVERMREAEVAMQEASDACSLDPELAVSCASYRKEADQWGSIATAIEAALATQEAQDDDPVIARVSAWIAREWDPGHEEETTLARQLVAECFGVSFSFSCDRCEQTVRRKVRKNES